MSKRNIELIKAFKAGETEGENHTGSMSIMGFANGDTLLVGYDNAVYAHRNNDTGTVTKFLDWVYGSGTNKQHIESFNADNVVHARPQITVDGKLKRDGVEILKRLTK